MFTRYWTNCRAVENSCVYVFRSLGTFLTVLKFRRLAFQKFKRQSWGPNFYLPGSVYIFLRQSHGCTDALFWIWTVLKPVKIQLGFASSCEQSENIEQFRVNEVFGPIFQPVENSPGAVRA